MKLYSLLASTGETFASLDRMKAGMILIVMALGAGYGGGIFTAVTFTDFKTHPDRIEILEESDREDNARIVTLERRQEEIDMTIEDLVDQDLSVMREMVYQLYCREFPDRCQAQPAEDR